MKLIEMPFFSMIVLWWSTLTIFAHVFLNISPLKYNIKNYFFCYAFLVAFTGIFADCIAVANKPFPNTKKILNKFPREWGTNVNPLHFLNLGKMCQEVYELYSLGNKNYQNPHNWTWNYELPHIMGNTIYVLAIIFLFLENKSSFLISLLFGSLILTLDYSVYILNVIYEIIKNKHSNSKLINMFVSWGTLDIPYMFFAGYFILWYAYSNLNKNTNINGM